MPTVTIQQAFEIAVTHHQAGRLAEAEAIYRQILAQQPQHVDALHLLGLLAHQVGNGEVAVGLIRQAIAIAPRSPAFHSNLGLALGKLGRADEAIAAFERALELDPGLGAAYGNLGNAFKASGRMHEAATACRRAVELCPDSADAHNNLGSVLRELGRGDEAIAAYRRAVALRSDFAMAHQNLGIALSDAGAFDEATGAFRVALRLQPDNAETHNQLGNALRELGRPEEAGAAFRKAIELQPNDPIAHNNLGNALTDLGRLDEAIVSYRRALELRPDYAIACNNISNALRDTGRIEEAIAASRRAVELQPDYAAAHNNLGNTLRDRGQIDEALAAYRRSLKIDPRQPEVHSNLLLALHYLPDWDADAVFREHCRWHELHAQPLDSFLAPHTNDPDPSRRLRVGYVSPDFREHAVACFMEDLLACHDPAQVETFCYSCVPRADAVTARLQARATHWREIAWLTDAQATDIIRRDGIDILVDLAGHTAFHRLLVFARKPAPVQVTYLGYCDTTGLEAMDYRLTDSHADPPGTTERFHTERLVRLPDCAWNFRPSNAAPPVGTSHASRDGCITFGCFSILPKLNGATFALWSRILERVPGSRLLLKNLAFKDSGARSRILGALEMAGISADRVELLGPTSSVAEHLATYSRVDIALDTFPYHGTTTTCEALWMGVPVISLAGSVHGSRVGVSILRNVGLPELIAQDGDDYVRIAAEVATNAEWLAELRSTLRERMTGAPLMDATGFARKVEAAYREMWRNWCVTGATPATP
ncbi:MAG: tetratricopeptide repeat protein [Chthoniobacteraceae bacterium]